MDEAELSEGMKVYSADGKRLGKIIQDDGDTLIIEKGLFFKKDYAASYDDIDRVDDDQVWLRLNADQFEGDRLDDRDESEDIDQGGEPEARRQPVVAQAGAAGMSAAGAQLGSDVGSEEIDDDDDVVVVVEEEEVLAAAPADDDAVIDAPPRSRR